jgi:hypothetical protein
MWPVTVGVAAKILGVNGPKLRRWINEGRFKDIDGLTWTENGFQRQRQLSRSWIQTVAKRINVSPNWKAADKGSSGE